MDVMKIDKYILRSILGAHSKSPIEQLHLETATFFHTTVNCNQKNDILTNNPEEIKGRTNQKYI